MYELPSHYRYATPEDAIDLAQLINIAGEGLPLYLWTQMVEGSLDPFELGRQRAMRDSGSFSFRNAVVREHEGQVVACLIGYPLPDAPAQTDYSDMPPMFVPLQQLEDLAPGTWYLNVLATYPEFQGRGYGSELLNLTRGLSMETGKSGVSIIVSDANPGARRLYERFGCKEVARRPMVKESWVNPGREWVLLVETSSR
ncbi:MAG: N-acetyltransferase [marine bacterium B5-7]|nr:MAG: N-acetyltransferase [marine bacterium B5-7]